MILSRQLFQQESGYVCKQGENNKNPMAYLSDGKPDRSKAGRLCPNRKYFFNHLEYYCEEGTASQNNQAYMSEAWGSRSSSFWKLSYAEPANISNEPIFYVKTSAYYNVLGTFQTTIMIVKTFSPIKCLGNYSCENSASRIWGNGKCEKGYFCPLIEKKGTLMTTINLVNTSYLCTGLVCECPEGKISKLNFRISMP